MRRLLVIPAVLVVALLGAGAARAHERLSFVRAHRAFVGDAKVDHPQRVRIYDCHRTSAMTIDCAINEAFVHTSWYLYNDGTGSDIWDLTIYREATLRHGRVTVAWPT